MAPMWIFLVNSVGEIKGKESGSVPAGASAGAFFLLGLQGRERKATEGFVRNAQKKLKREAIFGTVVMRTFCQS